MILRALLDNRGKRGDGATKPLLLVSPASHTLDRALAGVVGFEPNVVRVASTRAEGLKAQRAILPFTARNYSIHTAQFPSLHR